MCVRLIAYRNAFFFFCIFAFITNFVKLDLLQNYLFNLQYLGGRV